MAASQEGNEGEYKGFSRPTPAPRKSIINNKTKQNKTSIQTHAANVSTQVSDLKTQENESLEIQVCNKSNPGENYQTACQSDREPTDATLTTDETPQLNVIFSCDICRKDFCYITGAAFCSDCNQNYCLSCLKKHQKCNSTKHHKVTCKSNNRNEENTLPSDEYESLHNIHLQDTDEDLDGEFLDVKAGSNLKLPKNEKENKIKIRFCDLCDTYLARYIDEAVATCKECNKNMCNKCLKQHHDLNKNKHHKVIYLLEEYQHDEFLKSMNCFLHSDCSLLRFCTIHNEPICFLCKTEDKHKDCDEFTDIYKAAAGIKVDEEGTKQKVNGMSYLNNELKRLRKVTADQLDSMKRGKVKFSEKLTKQKDSIRERLKDAMNLKKEKITKKLDEHTNSLESRETECKKIVSIFEKQIRNYSSLLESGSQEEIFIMQTFLASDMRKYKDVFDQLDQTINTTVKMTDITVAKGLMNEIKQAENLIIRENLLIQKSPVDRRAVWIAEVDLAHLHVSDIVGMAILQEGEILLCDKATRKLILMDNQYRLINMLQLQSSPSSMAVISNGKAVICLWEVKSLQHVDIDQKLCMSKGLTVTTELPCLLISRYGTELVAAVEDTQCKSIVIMNIDGQILSRVYSETEGQLQDIYTMTVCPAYTDNIIYINSKKLGCFGLTMSGEKVFAYKDDKVLTYAGLCNDSKGNIFLAENDAGTIVLLNKNAEKIMNVVTMNSFRPNYIIFSQKDQMLMVHSRGKARIKAFKLI